MNNIESKEPEIIFAKVKDSAIIPSKEEENAGFDIYACWDGVDMKDRIIQPLTTKLIPTGIACALPTEYYFQVEERGSTGSKGIKKSAGVVDSGYRGEIFIAISNVNDKPVIFGDKDEYLKIAQSEFEELAKDNKIELTEEDKNAIIDDISASIFYPETKAIAQLVLHKVDNLPVKEISYDELKNIPSKRGTGALGSSGK